MSDESGQKGGGTDGIRKEHRNTFLIFLFLSALEIWALFTRDMRFEKWADWIIVGGAVMFPLLAFQSGRAMRNNWSAERSDQAVKRMFSWLLATPFLLAAAALGLWAVLAVFGWLGSIPGWAAVIIFLLVLLLLKRR